MFQAVLCCGENKAEGKDQRDGEGITIRPPPCTVVSSTRMFEEAYGGAEIQPPAGEKGAFF